MLTTYKNGTNNKKGMFYGKNESYPFTVFYIDNFYGFVMKLCVGLYTDISGSYTVKMTPGNQDGVEGGYDLEEPSQYKVFSEITPAVTGYVTKMHLVPGYGLFPEEDYDNSGSTTTYYCDYSYVYRNSVLRFGGLLGAGLGTGPFDLFLFYGARGYSWGYGVSLSCK